MEKYAKDNICNAYEKYMPIFLDRSSASNEEILEAVNHLYECKTCSDEFRQLPSVRRGLIELAESLK